MIMRRNSHSFNLCLRNKHPIKWIRMYRGQTFHLCGMNR